MAVQSMGGFWDDFSSSVKSTWDDLWGSSSSTSSSTYIPPVSGSSGYDNLFGWSSDPFQYGSYTGTTTPPAYDTTFDTWWKSYSGSGGVMTPTTGQITSGGSDIFSGISSSLNDFLSGVNGTLGSLSGIFGQGLQAYAAVQQLIQSQNPSDKIIKDPATGMVVVERTQGTSKSYLPLASAYPQFAGQIAQAEKSSNLNTMLLVGALALGGFILLKDKKKK